jgi:hypothetical protein
VNWIAFADRMVDSVYYVVVLTVLVIFVVAVKDYGDAAL